MEMSKTMNSCNSTDHISIRISKNKKELLMKKAKSMNITLTELIMNIVDQSLEPSNRVMSQRMRSLILNQKNFRDLFDRIEEKAPKEEVLAIAKKALEEEMRVWQP